MTPEERKRSPRGSNGISSQSETPKDWSRRQNQPIASPPMSSAEEPEQPSEAAADLVDQAKKTARATAKALSSQASELAGNIGGELTQTAEEQKSRGADAMRGFAKAVHGAANELDGQSPAVAGYVRSAARSVEGLSDTLRSRSVKDLVTTASDTARTHPMAFLIGSVAVGFALSRFFKSTSRSSTGEAGIKLPASNNASRNQPPGSIAANDGTGFGVGG